MLAMMPYGLCTLFTSSSSTATKCEDVALLDKKNSQRNKPQDMVMSENTKEQRKLPIVQNA